MWIDVYCVRVVITQDTAHLFNCLGGEDWTGVTRESVGKVSHY